MKKALNYRQLVENVNSIFLRMDFHGNITFLNDFGLKFFGYKKKAIIGKNVIGTIVPPSDFTGQDLIVMIQDILKHPAKYKDNENENMTADGRHVWISWTNHPVRGRNGKIKEILCIGNDITRIKKAEVELQRVKELTEAATGIGIVICTPNWQITAINAAAKKYFNLTSDKIDNFIAAMLQNYQPTMAEEKIKDLSQRLKTFDLVRPETDQTKALYLQVVMQALITPQQEKISVIFSIQDVTSQRTEELLKQDFLGLISHKLRTPAAVILDTARMLQQGQLGPLDEKQKHFVDILLGEGEKLDRLISNLLQFISINKQNIASTRETINICEHLSKMVPSLLAAIKDKKTSFTLDCSDKTLTLNVPSMYCDIVMGNLVDNAIKFNDKDHIDVNVAVKKDKDNFIVISFTDNGQGIPIEEQSKIFEGFHQVEKYFTGNVAGAGLGLPLIKKVLTCCGGKIELSSTVGQGSIFTLIFPPNNT